MAALSFLGEGLYSLPQAARIIGTSPANLRRWVAGRHYFVRGKEYQSAPVVETRFAVSQRTLTFAELIESLFVKLFRDEGVSMAVIRKAAKEAAKRFETSCPFAVKRFDTDGRRIFATLRDEEKDAHTIEELDKGQLVFDNAVRPFFRKLEYHQSGDANRYWPLGRQAPVVLDPKRSFGQPIDPRSGVPTSALFDAVQAGGGQSPKAVAEWFGVSLDAVCAAVKYEESLRAA
jgi:uncharacterized protein (DUF433 family)